ncbi:hypothetical protein Q4494_15175 [Celeribacter halophilus]|uniref:Uncharacterized protein n=1 Tax=Celeribacter halophilus TaxID=576117 RepID=A0AAW7XXN2_9RHOB|nr:hypothetical protein [Celeribacter halophilus]MDO6458431.1 hypothetical protein [Celeribacter halophilus]
MHSNTTFLNEPKTILDTHEAYKLLELMPELAAPFYEVLRLMGYKESIEWVQPRDPAT